MKENLVARVAVGALALGFGLSAVAAITTNTWTGAAEDGNWMTPENWSLGSVPGNQTVTVFDGSGPVDVSSESTIKSYTMIVNRGDVSISTTGGNPNIEIYGASGTSEVQVAENASLTFSTATFKPGGTSFASTVFVKRGLGTCTTTMGLPKDVLVAEGVLVARSKWNSAHVTVAAGAELREENVGSLSVAYPTVHLEKGAVLRLAETTTTSESRIGGLTGEGTVYSPNTRSTINLCRGPHLFSGKVIGTIRIDRRNSGTVTDEEARLILGSGDVFAECNVEKGSGLSNTIDGDTLRFAADVGTFRFRALNFGNGATQPLDLTDEGGLPVILEIATCNSGRKKFHPTGKGGLVFGSDMIFTADNRLADFAGTLAITNGTMTFDSTVATADLAALKGISAEAGAALSVSGAETLTVACPVRGAPLLSVNVNTLFDDFCVRGGTIAPSSGPVATMTGGLAAVDLLKFVNGSARTFAVAGGVLAGPFAVDDDLASVVPTVLKRPCVPVPSYEYSQSGTIRLTGGEIHLKPQSAANSVVFSALDGGRAVIHNGQFAKMPTVGFSGTTVVMCPPDANAFTPFGSAVKVASGGVTFVSGVSGGAASRNYFIVGADPDDGATGGVTRYGAGSFYTMKPMTITGPFRALDGVLTVPNSSQMTGAGPDIYGSGSCELGNVKFTAANGLAKEISLAATTVSGGAYVAPTASVVPTFASVSFADGGALFVEANRTVNFTTAPSGAPIFSVTSGTLSPTAACDADRHLVLNGGSLAEPKDFGAARGVLAVGADAAVTASLSGSAGVGFVGPADGVKRTLTLVAASGFGGGAFVNAVEVVPLVASALGTGPVKVGAGEWMGGRVRFTQPVTLANDFTVAGWGPADEQGALVFDASATIGSLAVAPFDARIRVNAGATARVSGKLSGGNLQIAGCGGVLEIAGTNEMSGRLDIIKATVRVSGTTASLGAGDVWLDNATLELANTVALSVTNRIYGIGTVACVGKDVTFDTPDVELSGRLRIAAGTTVTLDSAAQIDEDIKIYLPEGATLDLDGACRTVDRVVGSGTVRNGRIVAKRPWVPMGLLLLVK